MVFPAGAYNQRFQQEGIPTGLTSRQARDFGSGLYRGVTSLGAGAIGDLVDMFPTQPNLLMANAPRDPLAGVAGVFGMPYDTKPVIAPFLQKHTYNTEEAAQALTNLGVIPQPTGSMEEQTGEQLGLLPYLAGPKAIPDVLDLAMGLGARGVGAGMRGLGNVLEQPSMFEQASDALLSGAIAADPRMNVLMAQGLMAPEPKFKQPDYMGFRSTVEDVVNLDTFPIRGSAEQMEAALGQKGGLSKPITAQLGNRKIDKEELKFLGITDVLEEAKRTGQPVTKEQIQNAIESNRSNMYLEQEVLEDISPEATLKDEVLDFDEAQGDDYIQERIEEELTDNEYYAEQLAGNPDEENAIREDIYRMLEENYYEYPTQRIRLLDQGDETEIYAIGSLDTGYTIRMGGDNWNDSKTLTEGGRFHSQENISRYSHKPLELSSENEARVQLEVLAREEGIAGEGAQFREYVVEDYKMGNVDRHPEDYEMGNIGEVDDYREIVVRSAEEAGGNIGSHFGDDVAYHMRVSDRDYFDSKTYLDLGKHQEKALYVDEIQSDYAQAGAGRKLRLTTDEQTILDNLDIDAKTKNLALSLFDTPETKAARKELIESIERFKKIDHPTQEFGYDRGMGDIYTVERVKIGDNPVFNDTVETVANKLANQLKIGAKTAFHQGLKEQPLVAGQEKWVQHAVKNLITEMVKTGKDRVIFTSGKNQAAHWGEKGLEQFYDVRLKKEVEKVLKGIDKSAFEMVDVPSGRGREARQHISIKNTQKIKDFLEGVGGKPKGFGMYSAAPVAVGAGILSGQQDNGNVLAPSL